MADHDLEHDNPLPRCSGLELSAPQAGDPEAGLWLNAELVFGQEPLGDHEVSFRLGVKAGHLRLDLEGCHAELGTLYAMRDQPASIAGERREVETRHETASAKGGAGIAIQAGEKGAGGEARLGAGGEAGRSRALEVTTTREGTAEIRKVTFRGTRSEPFWEVTEGGEARLDGRYLGQENACRLLPKVTAYSVTARFVCFKSDLAMDIDPDERWLSVTRNKEKLALALIAKCLARDSLDGEIELSRSHLAARIEEE